MESSYFSENEIKIKKRKKHPAFKEMLNRSDALTPDDFPKTISN